MEPFANKEEYKKWIDSQDWYQTIELKNDLKTPGKQPTHERASILDEIDFTEKTVLDIGCNSGQYCFMAKEHGAAKVSGIDINTKRIKQARTLALNEGYDIEFSQKGIFDIDSSNEKYDIVLCVAVLTEIPDLFGAIEQIKKITRKYALVELDLAKPLLYLSSSKNWLRGNKNLSRQGSVAEVRHSKKGGWVISPTLEMLKVAFGPEFQINRKQGGVRYDLIEIIRK